jgi:hypothetical protein
MEVGGTPPYFDYDHYESTHDECDNGQARINYRLNAESFEMPEDIVECTEIVGKVVKCAKLYRADPDAAELQIDFEDGTSFSCILENKSSVKASLIQTGVGTPEVLRDYIA